MSIYLGNLFDATGPSRFLPLGEKGNDPERMPGRCWNSRAPTLAPSVAAHQAVVRPRAQSTYSEIGAPR